MAQQLRCPCGEHLAARNDVFLGVVRQHLTTAHPGRTYSDAEIRLVASDISDDLLGD